MQHYIMHQTTKIRFVEFLKNFFLQMFANTGFQLKWQNQNLGLSQDFFTTIKTRKTHRRN